MLASHCGPQGFQMYHKLQGRQSASGGIVSTSPLLLYNQAHAVVVQLCWPFSRQACLQACSSYNALLDSSGITPAPPTLLLMLAFSRAQAAVLYAAPS